MKCAPWMQTFSGREFHYYDPEKMDVSLLDIAHSLSNVCRFGGHTKSFYSVAQHSVIVSRLVGNEHNGRFTFFSLMHDAAEAYIGDIVRPLKHSLGGCVDDLEISVMRRICEYFDVPMLGSMRGDDLISEVIHHADETALATEARDLMTIPDIERWKLAKKPYAGVINPLAPDDARNLFLKRFFNSNQAIAKRVYAKEPEVAKYMTMNPIEWHEFQEIVK